MYTAEVAAAQLTRPAGDGSRAEEDKENLEKSFMKIEAKKRSDFEEFMEF